MSIEVKIVGFDRATERAEAELSLPDFALDRARQIAEVPSSDPDILGSYHLSDRQVGMIADLAHLQVDTSKFIYFLEAYDA